MYSVQTTLVEHKPQPVNGRNGQFTIHKFRGADGNWYETSKQDLANAAYALFQSQTQAQITYEVVQNGQYTNNRISQIQALGANGAMVPGALPPDATGAPAPTSAPPALSGPPTAPQGDQQRELKIHRQSALQRAIDAHAAGILKIESRDQLFSVADLFVAYFNGGRDAVTQPAPQGAGASPPPTLVVDEQAGAAAPAAAPASSEPPVAPAVPQTAPQGPEDDIPF